MNCVVKTMPDNYSQWEWHERERERRLAERPVCDICDQPIQDDYFYLINGDQVCPDCLENEFRKEVDLGA